MTGLLPTNKLKAFSHEASSINGKIKRICKENNVKFINISEKFKYDRTLFLRDGKTLSAKGKLKLATIIHKSITPDRNTLEQMSIAYKVSVGMLSGNEERRKEVDQT